MKKQLKDEKAITLIALVISIIVILILTGIGIGAITGNNGIVSQAKKAKTSSNERALADEIDLALLSLEISTLEEIDKDNLGVELNKINGATVTYSDAENKYTVSRDGYAFKVDLDGNVTSTNGTGEGGGGIITPPVEETTPGAPDEDGVFTVASTINGQAAGTNNPKIPAGFKPLDAGTAVWGDGTSAPSQTAVNAGLVIQHGVDKSEYVWIPVEGLYTGSSEDKTAVSGNSKVLLGRYVFNETTGVIDTTLSQSEPSGQLKTSSTDSYYYTEGLKNSTTTNTHANDIEGFISSVQANGGYYIARYEASKGTNNRALSIVSQGNTTSSASGVLENYLWNFITQPAAATACQNLYDGINSDLVNSYAWDTALLFIQKNSGNADYSIDKSGNVGTSTLKNTGSTGDVVCNIYDMSGNLREWTAETSSDSDYPCTLRGGVYYISVRYASYRGSISTSNASSNVSFRPLLYL